MRNNFVAVALALLGVAVLAGYYMMTRPKDPGPVVTATGTAGPVLVIDIEGEAEGQIKIQLLSDVAPQSAARLAELARSGAYDNVIFHRVIDGFMAQTGDVQFGKADGDTSRAGFGGSDLPDVVAEFSELSFDRGMVGMARSLDPDSANSQFFIMFSPAPHLNGDYTIVGQVVEGMEVVDRIKRGAGRNGEVTSPADVMAKVRVAE